MTRIRYSPILIILLLFMQACNPEVDVYEIQKELYVVYAVLNPDLDEQYVRITKLYQTGSDAIVYAAENDLTARGLNVVIQSDTMIWEAQLVEGPQANNPLFPKTTGVYRISTTGSKVMADGRNYELRITKPDDDAFLITSRANIPERPHFIVPSGPIYNFQTGRYTLPTIDFEKDQVFVLEMGGGYGFELRLMARYLDGNEEKIGQWGPTNVFSEPVNCVANMNQRKMCYRVTKRSFPTTLRKIFSTAQGAVVLDDSIKFATSVSALSQNVWVEVTAIDSFLSDYLNVNNPFGYGLDLLLDRKEITNISGGNLGVFGGISTFNRYFFLGDCTLYLVGLRPTQPLDCE